MTTEEKIKLYEELHPEKKAFPTNKKPLERAEDLQWLDEKITEFQELKNKQEPQNNNQNQKTNEEKSQTSDVVSPQESIKVTEVKKKTYTVNQIKCLPEQDFKRIVEEVEAGKAEVIN